MVCAGLAWRHPGVAGASGPLLDSFPLTGGFVLRSDLVAEPDSFPAPCLVSFLFSAWFANSFQGYSISFRN